MDIDVISSHYLDCTQYRERSDGGIAYYVLIATPKDGGEGQEIFLKPAEMASPMSFKRVLLGHKFFYTRPTSPNF